MAAQSRCHCQSCTIRSLVGPTVVITLGILWLLNATHGGRLYFGSTWPILLIVIGVLHLASSMASHEGHINCTSPLDGAPPQPPTPPASGASTPQTRYSSQGQ